MFAGCAQGVQYARDRDDDDDDDDVPQEHAAPFYVLASGVYELRTHGISSNCDLTGADLDGVLTDYEEHVGKLATVLIRIQATGITLQECDVWYGNQCEGEYGAPERGIIVEGQQLFAGALSWRWKSDCCYPDRHGRLDVNGELTGPGSADLSWTVRFPKWADGCGCTLDSCTATIDQRLVFTPDLTPDW